MILSDHHAMEFMTDYLRIMVGGNLNAFEIENLMDVEIETHHHEGGAGAGGATVSPTACRPSGSWRR
jgi:chemotaxis protein MotA